ncbi:DUF523 domain-containing protein [Candidatus Falkowbacteria bacterium]|nr:DUF523 domain-containing protein [Candidatus Falkowbacteria bacterium]
MLRSETYILKDKINVGISACNFGALVRYNRKGWDRLESLGREKDAFIWTPVCPEVMSGLGVPRHPMKLVDGNGDDFWQGKSRMKNKKGENISNLIKEGALAALGNIQRANVEAFVFMDGSPSCGVYRTSLKNARLGKPPGIFGSLLLKEQLFLIPSLDLDSPLKWWDWRRRLHAFVWLKRENVENKNKLTDIWHNYKFLCQEISRVRADKLGHQIAEISQKSTVTELEVIKSEVLEILRLPSSINRIKAMAEKQMGFYCKHLGVCYVEKLPSVDSAKQKFFEKLIELEKIALKNNINYGFVPVIYRDESRQTI